MSRICRRCKEDKDFTFYGVDKSHSSGKSTICKSCTNIKNKQSYNRCCEQRREDKRYWQRVNPNKAKDKHLRRLYGITLEQYSILADNQNNLCAICNSPEPSFDLRNNKFRALSVDHNHTTGEIRKLLCSNCNIGLGCFHDSYVVLQKAADYIKYHHKENTNV